MLRFRLFFVIWAVASVVYVNAASIIESADSIINNRYIGWTEERFRQYEDSLKSVLYPVVEEVETIQTPLADIAPVPERLSATVPVIVNYYVPNSMPVDTTKSIGQISIISGSTTTGAKTYSIPIAVYPGMRGFQPSLSLEYNSHQGNSTLGMGW